MKNSFIIVCTVRKRLFFSVTSRASLLSTWRHTKHFLRQTLLFVEESSVMKTFNVVCCVIFIYCCLDFAVFRIIALTNMNTGIIQKKGLHSSWTNSTMLQKALKQIRSDCDTNDSINFNFEYIFEANLSSIMGCFELLCGVFAPRKLHTLVTTFDDHDSQMLTQCAGLAGITVIGTSRSVSFQNKVKKMNSFMS